MSDLIDRQAALDIYDDYNVAVENGELESYRRYRKQMLELPSAQPVVISKSENATECEDAVSREAVLDEIHRYMEERDYTIGLLDDNVCGLPPVTPKQPGWIPCSERMPFVDEYGKSDQVLATCGLQGAEASSIRWLRILYFNGCNWCFPTGESYEQMVYAWMPLPTPWEGGQDGEG